MYPQCVCVCVYVSVAVFSVFVGVHMLSVGLHRVSVGVHRLSVNAYMFFYKHMDFRGEAQIYLTFSINFQLFILPYLSNIGLKWLLEWELSLCVIRFLIYIVFKKIAQYLGQIWASYAYNPYAYKRSIHMIIWVSMRWL